MFEQKLKQLLVLEAVVQLLVQVVEERRLALTVDFVAVKPEVVNQVLHEL